MKWNEMNPEDRNVLVHQLVMGKTVEACDSRNRQATVMRCETCGYEWGERDIDLQGYGPMAMCDRHDIPIPRYSESMDAAWLVIEHITKPPTTLAESERAAGTRFMFWFNLHQADLWADTAQDAASAICLAILKSVGVDIE